MIGDPIHVSRVELLSKIWDMIPVLDAAGVKNESENVRTVFGRL